jgi:hypothetical protein
VQTRIENSPRFQCMHLAESLPIRATPVRFPPVVLTVAE